MTDWLPGAIEGWARGHVGATEATVTMLGRPRSGQSNETAPFTVTWPGGHLDGVARVQPARPMFLDADVLREARVLVTLGEAGMPVPRVLGAIEDAPAPFFVMELVAGHVPFGRPSVQRDPWLVDLAADARQELWSDAMGTLVTLHDLDPAGTRAVLGTTKSDETVAADVERTAAWLAWAAQGRPFPVLEQAVERLRSWAPTFVASTHPVVAWGDARLGNMIVGDDRRVAAAIDWETASIGPREIDVGWWLMMDDYATTAVGVERLDGFPSPEDSRAYYEDRTGVRTADLDRFELLGALKLAITLLRTADALVERAVIDPDSRFAHDNVPTQMVARRLGIAVPDLSPDYRRLARLDP